MEIKIVSGIGKGKTALSAFDAALKTAGVYNYNLVRLSSIIPPGVIIKKVEYYKAPTNEYGHKLYVVMAEIRGDEPGKFIAAGIGWYQFGEDGRGIFVEHELQGETQDSVDSEINQKIQQSLKDLCAFRGIQFNPDKAHSSVITARVEAPHTAVLVIAVYKSERWE